MLHRIQTIDIEVTPMELAIEFWNMDGQQQADMLNKLGKMSGSKFDFQADYIVMHLDIDGRNVIEALAERLI